MLLHQDSQGTEAVNQRLQYIQIRISRYQSSSLDKEYTRRRPNALWPCHTFVVYRWMLKSYTWFKIVSPNVENEKGIYYTVHLFSPIIIYTHIHSHTNTRCKISLEHPPLLNLLPRRPDRRDTPTSLRRTPRRLRTIHLRRTYMAVYMHGAGAVHRFKVRWYIFRVLWGRSAALDYGRIAVDLLAVGA
jgi:hypothetical protein